MREYTHGLCSSASSHAFFSLMRLITTSGFRGPGRVTFEVRDFFKLGAEDEGERNSFDLIYDYT